MLPPKKRACLAHKKAVRRAKALVEHVLTADQVVPSGGVVEVRLCAGGGVGSCRRAERQLGITRVLDIDCRKDHLAFDGSPVHVYTRPNAQRVFSALYKHDATQGPFKLAAELERGWRVPGVEDYDADVGCLQGGWRDSNNHLRCLLDIVRAKFPNSFLVVLASPPCRMATHANQKKHKRDVKDYMKFTARFFRRIAELKRVGACDALLVEWSGLGRHEKGTFVPGKYPRRMLRAMNEVFNIFDVRPIQAAEYGSPSMRKRLLFAERSVFDFFPEKLYKQDWRGWGEVLGVCRSAKLSLITRTWRALEYRGKPPSGPATTITTMGVHIFIDRDGEDHPTDFALKPVQLAKLIGCDPFDPKLAKLAKLPVRQASVLVGISFSVQWYLAVMVAQMGAALLRGHCCGIVSKEHGNRVFWALEHWRRNRHPKPIPGFFPRYYRLLEDVKRKKIRSVEEFRRRARYFIQKSQKYDEKHVLESI